MKYILSLVLLLGMVALVTEKSKTNTLVDIEVQAQSERRLRWWNRGGSSGGGRGWGYGSGMGMGAWNGGGMRGLREEMNTIHRLLDNRVHIRREIDDSREGAIVTYTWSEQPQVSDWIKQHVAQMLNLVKNGRPIRHWDPLFQKLFERSDEIVTTAQNDDLGVVVEMMWKSACGESIAKMHAEVVSNFIARGRQEVHRAHPAPSECTN